MFWVWHYNPVYCLLQFTQKRFYSLLLPPIILNCQLQLPSICPTTISMRGFIQGFVAEYAYEIQTKFIQLEI